MSQTVYTEGSARTSRPDTEFSFFGSFNASNHESEYRFSRIASDVYNARLVIAVSQLLLIPFVLNDFFFFGFGNEFWQLVIARGSFLVVSILVWFLLSAMPPTSFDRVFALWSLTFAATAVFVVLHRPPGFIGILAANLFGVLICYLMMPLPLKLQALTAVAISVGHGVISLVVNPISDPVLRNTFVFIFVSANVIGFFSSRLTQRSRRREYATHVDLLNAERQYRTLVDASGSMVWTMLPDMTVDFVNKPWIEMTGHDSGRLLPANWSAIVHPDDAAEFVDRIAAHVVSGNLFEAVVRLRRHDGEYRWGLSRMVALLSESGDVEKLIGTTTDIHDHWEIKLKLHEANARLEEAAGRVRQLEEILSICSHCKKIRDENENWQPLEAYISARTKTLFSHSICPGCGVEHYGEIGKRLFGGNGN